MSEEALLKHVLAAMRDLGWRSAHFRPAKTEKGWRTAVQGDGKGFPDIVATKGHRLLVIELKGDRASVTEPEQIAWLAAFRLIPCAEVYIWKPLDWLDDTIKRVLLGVSS